MNASPQEIRRQLPFLLPCILITLVMCYVVNFHMLLPNIADLKSSSPVIRLYAGAVIGPFITPIVLIVLAVVILKAIPTWVSFTQKIEKPFNILTLLNAVVLILILTTSTFWQDYFMPDLGYSRCTVLEDNPTIWFTDWIKNPDWCVRGKSLAWVHEQAKLANLKPQ